MFISGAGEYGQGKLATDEQRQVNLVDNLSLTKGSHQLKFGVDYNSLAFPLLATRSRTGNMHSFRE